MTTLNIRPATPQQRDWATNLMARSEPWITLGMTAETCATACSYLELQLYIAHQDERPSGFVLLHPHGLAGSPYIKSVCVAEDTRSQGTGTALILFAEKLFRGESKHIFLCVSSFNKRAQKFYQRLGYHQVGKLKDYIMAGESELLLHKSLS